MNRSTAMKALMALVAALVLSTSQNTDAAPAVDKKIERLWKGKCASCHGADGKAQTTQGKKMAVGDMTSKEWQAARKDADMKKSLLEGFKREKDGVKQEKESFKAIPSDQLDALIALVRGFAQP